MTAGDYFFYDRLHCYANETRKVGNSRDPEASGRKDRKRGWLRLGFGRRLERCFLRQHDKTCAEDPAMLRDTTGTK